MAREGKNFEKDIKDSIPDDVFFYRFRDGTSAWGSNTEDSNTRFQQSNMCDCMLFDGKLYLLELKSHKGKSLPFSVIRENQLKELSKAEQYNKVIPGFIVNFRDVEKTYFVHIKHIYYFVTHADRKSIPLEFFEQYGKSIEYRKLKVHYRYNISKWLGDGGSD